MGEKTITVKADDNKNALNEFNRVTSERDDVQSKLDKLKEELNSFKEKEEVATQLRVKELSEEIAKITKEDVKTYSEMNEDVLKKILEGYKKVLSINESAKTKGIVTESSKPQNKLDETEPFIMSLYEKNGDLEFREDIALDLMGLEYLSIPQSVKVKGGE